jgi:hypothetical protein
MTNDHLMIEMAKSPNRATNAFVTQSFGINWSFVPAH